MARQGTADAADDVETAADELYGLPLNEFTTARNERARLARAHGETSAAAAIGRLAKPSTVAWLANQLVRGHADQIRPLLELGDSMRRATASLDAGQLRQLSRQQHQLVHTLVQQARSLASAAGQAISDSTTRGLADTLHAALADEQAARQLLQGRLTSGLSRSGFPGIDASAQAVAAPVTAAGRRAQPGRHPQPGGRATAAAAGAHRERTERARRDEASARSDAADADRARGEAHAILARAAQAAQDAAGNVARLEAELDAALRAQADADRADRRARKAAGLADRAASQAQRRLEDATARRIRADQG